MRIKVGCPACGRVEEYEPDEEDMRVAQERGVASVSFFHGDHVLVVHFDASGMARRVAVLKTVGEVRAPAMPFEDLINIVGKERLALVLAALPSGGKAILASSSRDLAQGAFMALRRLLEPMGISGEVASDEEGLRAAADRPGGTVIIADRSALPGAVGLPPDVVVIDLDVPSRLTRREKKALRVLLKTLDKALRLRDEDSKVAVVRSRLLRLKVLVEKAAEILGQVSMIGETMLRRTLDPSMSAEELDLVLFALSRFRGVDTEEKVLRGAREFFLPGLMEQL